MQLDMIVTKRTRTRAVLPLLTQERLESVLEQVPEVRLPKDVVEFTIGEFIESCSEEYALRFLRKRYALDALGMVKSFRRQMKEIADYMQRCELHQTSEERAASSGIAFPTFSERLLIDCMNYFHLNSMEQAENVKLAEYLLILKDRAASARFERAYAKQQEKRARR